MEASDSKMPKHIGIIMDANRRWAKERGLPSSEGHRAGAKTLDIIIQACKNLGIKILTVYALSTENLENRSKEELKVHFELHKKYIERELKSKKFEKEQIRFRVLGRKELLPKDEQELIKKAEDLTKKYDKYFLNVCLVYSGQDEIVDAVKEIIKKGLKPEQITREVIKKNLYTKDLPPPDLIIRTGMDKDCRLSGFLLWDSSYSEFYFTKTYWPDFSEEELKKVVEEYKNRQRRFGK